MPMPKHRMLTPPAPAPTPPPNPFLTFFIEMCDIIEHGANEPAWEFRPSDWKDMEQAWLDGVY